MKKTETKRDHTIHVGLEETEHEEVVQLAKKEDRRKSTMARVLIKEALQVRKTKKK